MGTRLSHPDGFWFKNRGSGECHRRVEGTPGALEILGHTYKVKKTNTLSASEGAVASCNTSLLEISIDTNFPESVQREGLLHEIIEAMNYHMELELEHNKIAALSEGLFAVLRNNKLTFCKE